MRQARHFGYGLTLGLLFITGLTLIGHTPDVSAFQPATLPPTWTPTFTITASITPTITPTATATSTLEPEAICDLFRVYNDLGDGYSYAYDTTFRIVVAADVPDGLVQLSWVHRLSGENLGAQFPAIEFAVIQLPIAQLPRHGLYDWSVALTDSAENPLCDESGYFFAGAEAWLMPTPAATADVQYIVVTTTPQVIIVTATPQPVSSLTPIATPIP